MMYPSLPGYIFSRTYIFRHGNASPVLTIYNSSYRRGRGVVKPTKNQANGPIYIPVLRFHSLCRNTTVDKDRNAHINLFT